ncbi:MAG TPA: metallophosphoesterase [Chloroflexia bacterium]|nr:metallophosphoesterase [Chloroflexia bacterium]
MTEESGRNDRVESSNQQDRVEGQSRRGFLKCMAWAGTGLVWTVSAGGLLSACGDLTATPAPATDTGFTFVQISDTHIGFNSPGVNTDVPGTTKQAIDRINALPQRPALVLHTGDVSHNSKAEEFDLAKQLIGGIKTDKVFYVPGEHDLLNDKGATYRQQFGSGSAGKPWYSMDYKGVHFIALSNAGELDAFGMLGAEQIDWLKKDLAGLKKDTPLIVFAHVPLYSVYPAWGWETKDSAQAMSLLMPFSAVTVLNGHIHQVLSKVEGNINFYTAYATAFPQHKPGVDKPNAYKLPANELLQSIGYRTVNVIPGKPGAAVTDTPLANPTSVQTVVPAATPSAVASATTAAAGLTVNAAGVVDAGPVSEFSGSATKPQSLNLALLDGKSQATVFVVQQGQEYLALSDICTHQGCEVNWDAKNNLFQCPCHGSQYDLTGKNIAGPAPRPLPRFKTEVVNNRLLITVTGQANA